jgi:hypothetical protein
LVIAIVVIVIAVVVIVIVVVIVFVVVIIMVLVVLVVVVIAIAINVVVIIVVINGVADTDSMSNTLTHALSICSFALFGQGENKEGVYDLTSSYGKECYLVAVLMVRITKGALTGGYFCHWLDGMRHNWIPASRTSLCQWCNYKLNNEYDEKDRQHFQKALQQS